MSKGRDRPGKEKRKPKSDKNKKKKAGDATPAQTPGSPPKPTVAIAGKQI
jgi:hypothetical protein